MFKILFALNRLFGPFVTLDINQCLDVMMFRETVHETLLMFINTPNHIVRYTDIERSVRLAGKQVDVIRRSSRVA
jgi:hypothetical protein